MLEMTHPVLRAGWYQPTSHDISNCTFWRLISNILFQYASKELECLKNAMEDLTKIQEELAEFFCEDPKSFKLEECYKAFLQFNNNFKKAVVDNEKRKEQERSAEQRRLQRETEQAKRRSGSFQGKFSFDLVNIPLNHLFKLVHCLSCLLFILTIL